MDEPLIMDRLDSWRAEGGPPLWCAAFDRVLAGYRPLWAGKTVSFAGGLLAHGAVGVVTAIYILAREQNVPIDQVTRAQVEGLTGRGPGQGNWDRVKLWEDKLRALGHNPDDEQDPVMARWRELREDLSPPDPWGLSDEAYYHVRIGPRLANSVGPALAPMWTELQL